MIQGTVRSAKGGGGDLDNPRNQPEPKPPPKHHPWDQHQVNFTFFYKPWDLLQNITNQHKLARWISTDCDDHISNSPIDIKGTVNILKKKK